MRRDLKGLLPPGILSNLDEFRFVEAVGKYSFRISAVTHDEHQVALYLHHVFLMCVVLENMIPLDSQSRQQLESKERDDEDGDDDEDGEDDDKDDEDGGGDGRDDESGGDDRDEGGETDTRDEDSNILNSQDAHDSTDYKFIRTDQAVEGVTPSSKPYLSSRALCHHNAASVQQAWGALEDVSRQLF